MSMNINIVGEREVCVTKDPSIKSVERITFNRLQTPTNVTYKILEQKTVEGQIQAYKDWVIELFPEDEIIEEVDFEGNPTGVTTTKNYATEHIQELDEFLEQCKQGLYEVDVFMK